MIKHTTEKDFLKVLKEHPLENVGTIKHIERSFSLSRGYVNKMPDRGSDVIHLVSGGIDSISSWAILLEEFKLRVHPVCINTGQRRHIQELRAVSYFSDFLKKRYPKLYVEPFHLTFPSSAPEISEALRGNLAKTIHPQVLKDNYNPQSNTVELSRKFLFPAFFPYPAALAALFFELQRNIKIRTIFCSILPTDGLYNASQTLTSLRAAALSLCTFTNDYSWQVVSVCFEKEFGLLLHKSDLIRWAYDHKIPIENTYTCLRGNKFHCGECLVCGFRKESFVKAQVQDKTVYFHPQKDSTDSAVSIIKRIVKPFKPLYKPILSQIRSLKINRKIFIKDYY